MANKSIKNIQAQLNQLATICPELDLKNNKHWVEVVRELEHLTHRTNRQEAFLETGHSISNSVNFSINLNELLNGSINLIQKILDFYYIAIFLLDETGKWAELKADNSSHQNSTLAKQHRLAVNDKSTVGWVINHKQPFITAMKPGIKPISNKEFPDTQSEAVTPLTARGEVIGSLVLQCRGQSVFSDEDFYALQTLGGQLANAIQNVIMFAAADKQLEQLVDLHNISLQLDSHTNVNALLNSIAQLSTKLLDTDACIIRFIDNDKQLFMVRAAYTPPPHINVGYTETLNLGLSHQVIKTQQAILANDWPNYPLAKENRGPTADTLAILNVPIGTQDKIVGTIEVQSFTKLQAFDKNDHYVLSLLASQAAIILERTRLLNRVENNQRFLKTVIEHIPDPIFIKDRNHTWIEMNQANATVIGRSKQDLIGKNDEHFFSSELVDEFYRRDDEVFTSNQIFEYEDKTIWGDGQEHTAYTRLIPISGASEEPEYMLGITNDITERKAHEAERERFLAETAALYQGSKAIASALSEYQIYEALFEQIRLEDPCEIAAFRFQTVNEKSMWAELKAGWQKRNNPTYPEGVRFYLPETPQASLLTTPEALFINDIATDPRLSKTERESFAPTAAVSMAILPLIFIGQELGSVLIYFTQTHIFSEVTQRFWLAIIDQARIALSSRRFIQEVTYRTTQMETAAEVARAASSLLDLNELLNSAVEMIGDRFDLYYVGVFLVDETNKWAELRSGSGEAGQIQLQKKHRLKIDSESMIGWSMQHQKPRIALDVSPETIHFKNPDLPLTRSEMAIPLIYRNTVIGALTVQSVEQAAFSKDDTIFLQTMADQLANAIENARLFAKAQATLIERHQAEDELLKALARTESFYRIGDAAATATDQDILFETILGEYLRLLNLKEGVLALLHKTKEYHHVHLMYVDGRPVETDMTIPVDNPLFQQLLKKPEPLVIGNLNRHRLTKNNKIMHDKLLSKSALYNPVIVRGKVIGLIIASSTEKNYAFSQNDIETGQAVTDQLAIWLENRQLLTETQHRSERLQTAAEVSRAASSILDVGELINTSVNLIRDQFEFYYVGLFLVDKAKEWAVLRAGTGEAGRIQLEHNHKLEIGGESMIGWSVAHRKARIALDVGEEAVRFKNPILPDTRSEMALPLINRDEAIGALTVQSVERVAFSDEDVTLLQTMADQLSNAIVNARLFENVAQARREAEAGLQETTALQQLSRKLAGTLKVSDILDTFLEACTKEIGFEYVLLSLVDELQNSVKVVAGIKISKKQINLVNCPLDSNDIMADIIRTGRTEIITSWDDRFDKETFAAEGHINLIRIFTPIVLRQENIGLVEAGFNKNIQDKIQDSQVRLLRVFINQTALALDNAQRYEASQKAARREALIKEITTKVRASTDLDTILKTTVKEVGDVINNKRAYIHLVSPQETNGQQDVETEGSGG